MAKRTPLQQLLDRVPKPLKNRYILVIIGFMVWMLVFDKHDVLTQVKLQSTVNKMRQDREMYKEKIEEAKQERLDLEVNKEQFAREQYYMKKRGEDVFIIEETEE
jgi:cell division protein FtsB